MLSDPFSSSIRFSSKNGDEDEFISENGDTHNIQEEESSSTSPFTEVQYIWSPPARLFCDAAH